MRLRDNPLLYLGIFYLISRFVRILLIIQLTMTFLYPDYILSLTFYLACIIMWLCEEYLFSYLNSINFRAEDYINEL